MSSSERADDLAKEVVAQLPPITYVSPSDMTLEMQAQRAEDMKAMYHDPTNPLSMVEIGIIYGLTRERVRQIFKQFDVPVRTTAEARKLSEARQKQLAEEQ